MLVAEDAAGVPPPPTARSTGSWRRRTKNKLGRKGRWEKGRFVLLPHFMLDSDAWFSLRPEPVSAYVQLAKRFNGYNNGAISLSVGEAAALCHVNAGTAGRVLHELEDKGFTRCVRRGDFFRRDGLASEWELTLWPFKTMRKWGTRDFMHWRETEDSAPRAAPAQGRGQSVTLPLVMLDSQAWASLKPAAVAVYVRLAQKFNGRNNGRIPFSVDEAARLCRIAPNTAMRALRDLEAKGLISRVTPGGFSCKVRRPTEWGLTVEPLEAGRPASNDFERWRAPPLEKNRRSQTEASTEP